MNLAALYRLPVLFICENNFYASHLSLLERRAKDNIIDSGKAHAVPGFRLDGNDVEAVYSAAAEAAARARSGQGPTLLECRTYRWRGHVGPDPNYDVGVLRRDELKEWIPKDPVARTARALESRSIGADRLAAVALEVDSEVAAAVDFALESPYPDASELGDHLFAAPLETHR